MRYKIRTGYVFLIGRDRRIPEGTIVDLTDKQIIGQEHKLDLIPEEKPEEEKKDKNIPHGQVRDRMVKGTENRGVPG